MKTIDFLREPTSDRLRREIKNICNSYSHPWDILAELIQNAVDSIILYNKKFGEENKKNHSIKLEINAIDRSILIRDTGTGFSSENFADLLAPHGTDKDNIPDTIGEKGVGLTYTIFVSNLYKISTKSNDAFIEGEIKNASLWKDGKLDDLPVFTITRWDFKKFSPLETFTEIYLKDFDKIFSDEEDIFSSTINTLEYIIRTKTALGWLKGIFKEQTLDLNATLIYINNEGNKDIITFKPTYMLPEEFLDKTGIVELDTFKELAATLDDRQKARKLQGKAIIKKGAIQRSNKKINYYVLFAPSRNMWKDISEKGKIFYVDNNGNKKYFYGGGIYVGTKGMPTGIRIEPPLTGYAGYWPNFYMILEDDSIVFDLGRKFIPGRTKGLLRDIAKQLFQEFLPFIQYATSDPPIKSGTTSTIQQYQKANIFEELKKLPDLKIDKINYLKHPDGQEAGVVALFHELVGSKILKGYYTLKTGYKQTYDLWGFYRISKKHIGQSYYKYTNDNGEIEIPIIIEFKYKGEDILNDFEKDIKYFTDIDLIVCWDLDERKFAKQSVKVETIPESEILFFGSNYKLIWPGAYNLGTASEKPVIALRRFIEKYLENN